MKIFSDFYTNKVYKEFLFESFDDVLRLYALEDIITSPKDLLVASIYVNNKSIYYSKYSDLKILTIPKNKSIDLFVRTIKNHTEGNQIVDIDSQLDGVLDQITFRIKILAKTTNTINIELTWYNLDYTVSEYKTLNQSLSDKYLNFNTTKIPCVISLENPEFLLPGDTVEYKYKYYIPDLPNIRGLNRNRVYLNLTNSTLIIPDEIPQSSLAIALNSNGNIIRGKTINDLYKFSKNYPFIIDESISTISIPERFIIPKNRIVRVVDKQQLVLSSNDLEADFSLIGIGLDSNLRLNYYILLNKQYYNQIIQNMNGVSITENDVIWLGFAIVNNIGSKIIQYDLFILNIGGNGGGGGNIISKTKIESCEKEVTIQFNNSPPIVQLYDKNTKEQIVPQEIRYDSNNVYIKLTDSNINLTCYEIILL